MKTIPELPAAHLYLVTGGASTAPAVQPLPITPHGMAPPKYSAGWWDFVRARGLAK